MERLAKRSALLTRQYHVVLHDGRWWVEDEHGAGLHAASAPQDAVVWAIRRAQQDQADDLDVMVCVEQPDGSWKVAWHS